MDSAGQGLATMEHHFDVPGDDLDRLKNQAAADNKADQVDGELSFTEVRFYQSFLSRCTARPWPREAP